MIQSEFFVKSLINVALVLIIIPVGFVLHAKGKPLNSFLFNIHKLATIGFIIYMASVLVKYSKAVGLSTLLIVLICITVISLIGLLLSGAFLSLDRFPVFMLRLHNVTCLGFVICIAGIFYEILFNS